MKRKIEEEIKKIFDTRLTSEYKDRLKLFKQYSDLIYYYFQRLIQKHYETLRNLVEEFFRPKDLFERILSEIRRLNIPLRIVNYNEDFG